MKKRFSPKIHSALEDAYRGYHVEWRKEVDPISLVHHYSTPQDREVAALFAALLAYGNVQTIRTSVSKVLAFLGQEPHQKLFSGEGLLEFNSFKHRFTTATDIQILFHWVGAALKIHGSLENLFLSTSRPQSSMQENLSRFVRALRGSDLPGVLRPKALQRERNLKYLLSDPMEGSACKRLNLFLRWVIRPDDGIDLGLWKRVPPAHLILPVDTHVLKAIRSLRWTQSKSATWKVAEVATDQLRRYCPEDPIRYDFSLCHLSMSGSSFKELLK